MVRSSVKDNSYVWFSLPLACELQEGNPDSSIPRKHSRYLAQSLSSPRILSQCGHSRVLIGKELQRYHPSVKSIHGLLPSHYCLLPAPYTDGRWCMARVIDHRFRSSRGGSHKHRLNPFLTFHWVVNKRQKSLPNVFLTIYVFYISNSGYEVLFYQELLENRQERNAWSMFCMWSFRINNGGKL